MAQYHTLTISDIRQLTNDSVAISFAVPEELQQAFQFQHGQFVQLKASIAGELIERSYSVCSAPYERKLVVGIKRVDQGLFSNFACDEMKLGDEIQVSEPQGVFTHTLDSSQKKTYLLVAAGSGITPILSIIKMTLASESLSQCCLIYANKSPESSMFREELEQLTQRYSDRFHLVSVYSQSDEGELRGRLNLQVIEQLYEKRSRKLSRVDEFFVCGPKEMSIALHEAVLKAGISAENAHIELFEASTEFSDIGGDNAVVTMKIDGESFEFTYDDPTRSILDVALDYDGDLPYGCQNGSCGSCQAKIVSGSAEMEVNFALSQSEIDEGFVLVCQARPTSKKIEIDYDA